MSEIGSPVLSVLIPTHNYGKYIAGAIASVTTQRRPDVEIVVVDDGSSDDTPSILTPLEASGSIRYIRQENRGPSAARNRALQEARGTLLMFLDADDELMPACIETTIGFFDRHPQVGFFFTNYDIFDDDGIVTSSGVDTWSIFRDIPHDELDGDEWIFSVSLTPYIIRYGGFMHTSGLTVRREVVDKAGLFREGYSYGEDDDFYARAAYVTQAGYVDRVLSRKRNHAGSLIHSSSNRLRNARHRFELTEIQAQHYRDDSELQAILREKSFACARDYAWALLEESDATPARRVLWRYLGKHPFSLSLYRLLLKSFIVSSRQTVFA